jgi:hypothetical protein
VCSLPVLTQAPAMPATDHEGVITQMGGHIERGKQPGTGRDSRSTASASAEERVCCCLFRGGIEPARLCPVGLRHGKVHPIENQKDVSHGVRTNGMRAYTVTGVERICAVIKRALQGLWPATLPQTPPTEQKLAEK